MEQRVGQRSCHGYNFRSIRTLCAWHSFAFAPSTRSNLKEGMLRWWRAQQQTFGGVKIKRRYRAHCWQHEICFAFVEKRPSMGMTRRIHPRHNLKPRKPNTPHTTKKLQPQADKTKNPYKITTHLYFRLWLASGLWPLAWPRRDARSVNNLKKAVKAI